jgi:hypothetical protein
MRLAQTMLACALSACACVAAPAVADGAPGHDRGLTIHAVPRTILAGESVLIFGRLEGPGRADQTIDLYHRVAPAPSFSLIGTTTTNALGLYEFTREEGIVETNRSWFVRGPDGTHSKTIAEHVLASVSLAASAATGTTLTPLVFSGNVAPDHTGGLVSLQEENPAGTGWVGLKRAIIGPGSDYQISYAWRVPGAYAVRAVFHGDLRNDTAPSDPVTVLISQAQVPWFTIDSSDPIVPVLTPVTISGVLDQARTTTPQPDTSVTLFEREPGTAGFSAVATTVTASDGAYSFADVESDTNELYRVSTTFAPHTASALLFEGVQDSVTLQAGTVTALVGDQVTFSGNVSPDQAGNLIYLEQQGPAGGWRVVATGFVSPSSTYGFNWTVGTAGPDVFRTHITGDPANLGNVSAPVTVFVSLPPVAALPTG